MLDKEGGHAYNGIMPLFLGPQARGTSQSRSRCSNSSGFLRAVIESVMTHASWRVPGLEAADSGHVSHHGSAGRHPRFLYRGLRVAGNGHGAPARFTRSAIVC